MAARELSSLEVRRVLAPGDLAFETTRDVEPAQGVVAQSRALDALEFGLTILQPRFHVVVVGSPGSGRGFSIRSVAERIAKSRPTPDDLLLLPNPVVPSEPIALFLPAGEGRAFCDAMSGLHAKLLESLHAATEGERFKQAQTRAQRKARSEEARLEKTLVETAREHGYQLERSGDEVEVTALEPVEGGEEAEEAAEQGLEAVKNAIEEFEGTLADVHEEVEIELRAAIKQLLADAVAGHFAALAPDWSARVEIVDFLKALEQAVVSRMNRLIDEPRSDESGGTLSRGFVVPTLLTEHAPDEGAPVVEVAHPTVASLFGRSHSPPDAAFPPEPGFAVAGALHEANGGFLILPAVSILKNEGLYEQLKACLLASRFLVPEQNPSYYRGTAEELLFPSIPIDLKVILVAGPGLFQELHAADPEFSQLFRVQARFEPTLPFEEARHTYPAFLSGLVRKRGLLHMTREAVAALIFHGGRLGESQSKVTSQLGLVGEVAVEASYLATKQGKELIDGETVMQAIDDAQRRGSHFRDALHELLRDGTIRIETEGSIVGQVNAISVLSDGPVTFGRPCRVTAVVYPGTEGPVNIAREVEMSGPIHSKGVMVLTGFLASRFARTRPMSFSASLVFEQTYEGIDGDSASSSELYGLLSALSRLPLRQDLAVTGSVDQRGSIQPVGGLNEKIESFYDVCLAKGGLSGTQGVLIPSTNIDSLMLRKDVVQAIAAGSFHVYAVQTVEEGIELLTGVPAGEPVGDDGYTEGSVYASVDATLRRYWEIMRKTR